jgi:hypothetical protein
LGEISPLAIQDPGRLQKRGYPKTPRKAVGALNANQRLFLEYMIHGCRHADLCKQIHVEPHTPLSIEQAADLTRIRRRFARWLFEQPEFRREYGKAVQSLKNAAHVEAVNKQIEIMRHVGDGSAADKAIALKATQALLDDGDSKNGSQVNIQLNNHIQLQPGIVIRLRGDVAETPLEKETLKLEPMELHGSYKRDQYLDETLSANNAE